MNANITEYSPIEAAIAGIEKYRGLVVDVTTAKGMKEAKAIHREVAEPRIALEKTRKKLKEDVLERGRLIDGEAKRIAARIAEIEDPLKAQIDAQERAEEEARQAAIKAEQDRIAAEERAKKEAEEKRLAEDRAKLEAERARLRAEQDAREAAEREARRAEQERLDAVQMLRTFEERYGELAEFGAIVAAIRAYFQRQKRRAA